VSHGNIKTLQLKLFLEGFREVAVTPIGGGEVLISGPYETDIEQVVRRKKWWERALIDVIPWWDQEKGTWKSWWDQERGKWNSWRFVLPLSRLGLTGLGLLLKSGVLGLVEGPKI
jgi:hypothetical protein